MLKSQLKMRIWAGVALVILIPLLALFLFSGDNFDLVKSMFTQNLTNDELIEKMGDFGIKGYVTVSILAMLQVIFTILPAEPVQVLAGLSFGFPFGLLCCLIGVFVGNTVIFVLFRIFGDDLRAYFVRRIRVDLDKVSGSANVALVVLVLYFLPAIPYGMICFLAASLGMKYPRYITITLLGAVPSVCIGVGFGHLAGVTHWWVSVAVLGAVCILLLFAFLKRDALFDKINAYLARPPFSSKTRVRPCGGFRLWVAYVISRLVFLVRGARVRYTNKLGGEVDALSIVLCNHGSFIDFAYAGTLLRKRRANFIVARMYFYKRWVKRLITGFGCFPKSMFAADIESAKNCLRVLREGRVLAMMPEARLSTVGRFEDIQESTFSFLKNAKVPVYSIKIGGDYLADPKWGNGFRQGSLIEAELDILFTPEELAALSVEEIKERTVARLAYDEFEWLAAHPEQRYRSRRLAEGLDGILTLCPKCHGKYTIRAKGRQVLCASCGRLTEMNDRYGFSADFTFPNFAEWYDWQRAEQRRALDSDPDAVLSSPVELRLPSLDGKHFLRTAGKGVCTLSAEGLAYEGTRDGETVSLFFPIEKIYRLLFGAGENFEVYDGECIHYFVPEEKRASVDFYTASAVFYERMLQTAQATALK